MLRVTLSVLLVGLWTLPSVGGHDQELAGELRQLAIAVDDSGRLDPLIEEAAEGRLVLLGEASHGTSQFYTWRAHITQRLIVEHDFRFLAVEGDWAALYEVNRYIKHLPGAAQSGREVLGNLQRWPTWMWANEEVEALVEWLRRYNAARPLEKRVGFYGIDLYGPWESMDEVSRFAAGVDPEVEELARAAFRCLRRFEDNPTAYVRAVLGGAADCRSDLDDLLARLGELLEAADADHRRHFFAAKQNALVVQGAKRHYLAMAERGPASWNRRAEHFQATVSRLLEYHGAGARGIVWAHNTHIGDARATAMAAGGQRNIGQLARQRYGPDDVYAVGFGTHRGTVNAGSEWGAEMEIMTVPPGIDGSFEALFHEVGLPAFLLLLRDDRLRDALSDRRDHRAIGVVYDPAREHLGNYVPTMLPQRYDAFIFIDQTRALTVLE